MCNAWCNTLLASPRAEARTTHWRGGITRAAKRLGLSRSELFTRAVKAFSSTRLEANITPSYDVAFADGDEAELIELRRRATRDALLDVEWSDE